MDNLAIRPLASLRSPLPLSLGTPLGMEFAKR
jgi:hypothetical protein